jgi:hypothetical protein
MFYIAQKWRFPEVKSGCRSESECDGRKLSTASPHWSGIENRLGICIIFPFVCYQRTISRDSLGCSYLLLTFLFRHLLLEP